MAESMSQMEQFTSTLASLQSSHHHSSSSSSSLNHSGHSLTGHHTSGHHSGSGNHHHHSSSSSSGRHGGSSRSSQSSSRSNPNQNSFSSSRSNSNQNSLSMHHHVKSSSSSHGHGQQQLYGSGSSSVAFPTSQRVIHTNNGLGHQQATIMQLQQQSNNRNHLVPTSIAFPSFNHHQQSNAAVQLLQLPIINTIQQQPIQVQSSSSSKSSRNQSNQQMTVQIQQLQQINNGSGQTITLSSIGGHGSSSASSAAPAAAGPAVKKAKKKYPKKKPETAAYNPYQDPTSDYSPHCPKAWNRKVTGQVFCRGCGKAFLKYSNGLYEKGYYVHCIKECREYRDLDMVKSCHDCRHLFINKKSFSQHPCEKAKKKELKEMKSMAQA